MTRAEFKSSVEDIFGVRPGTLKESDTRDTIEGWTSVADVQILTLVSTEMGIEPEAELIEAETFGDMVDRLVEKGGLT